MQNRLTQDRFYEICECLGRLQLVLRYYKPLLNNAANNDERRRIGRRVYVALRALCEEYGLTECNVRKAQDFNGYILSVKTSEGVDLESAVIM